MSFIRPLLEYGNIFWDNCTSQQKSDIDSVQNEAARIVKYKHIYLQTNININRQYRHMYTQAKWNRDESRGL